MRDSNGSSAEHKARDEPHFFSNTGFPPFITAVM
jgi:hypothetical protein